MGVPAVVPADGVRPSEGGAIGASIGEHPSGTLTGGGHLQVLRLGLSLFEVAAVAPFLARGRRSGELASL